MENQDEQREHNWYISHTDRYPSGYIEYERCWRCKAFRVVQYPPGIILDSKPKPVPKYCSVEESDEY